MSETSSRRRATRPSLRFLESMAPTARDVIAARARKMAPITTIRNAADRRCQDRSRGRRSGPDAGAVAVGLHCGRDDRGSRVGDLLVPDEGNHRELRRSGLNPLGYLCSHGQLGVDTPSGGLEGGREGVRIGGGYQRAVAGLRECRKLLLLASLACRHGVENDA